MLGIKKIFKVTSLKTKIISPTSPLKEANSQLSLLKTECLFGENISILEKMDEWSYCKCELDDYVGWVQNKDIGFLPETTHLVSQVCSLVFDKPDIKSHLIFNIYLNSKVTVLTNKNNWAEIALDQNRTGFIPANHLNSLENITMDWINTAKNFKNTPYLWGGKTYLGIDCSGLVQISLMTSGIFIPRDSFDQLLFNSKEFKTVGYISKGCLVFWKGHVAIATSSETILHSNSSKMLVIEENITDVINRFSKEEGKITGIKQVLTTGN